MPRGRAPGRKRATWLVIDAYKDTCRHCRVQRQLPPVVDATNAFTPVPVIAVRTRRGRPFHHDRGPRRARADHAASRAEQAKCHDYTDDGFHAPWLCSRRARLTLLIAPNYGAGPTCGSAPACDMSPRRSTIQTCPALHPPTDRSRPRSCSSPRATEACRSKRFATTSLRPAFIICSFISTSRRSTRPPGVSASAVMWNARSSSTSPTSGRAPA